MAGIYIHIPFCKQACYYCDFHFSTSLKYKDDMLKSIRQEMALQKNYLGNGMVKTIYFGGGSPSLLTGDEINQVLETIHKHFGVASDAEITLEANPDDLTAAKVKEFRDTAVNRFSIGIQSFFDEDLQWMNRAHRSTEAEASVKRVQDAGFENITADLIFGYPLLSNDKLNHNVQKMLALDIPHISAYAMTVEPKTALASFISKKLYPPVNEAQSAAQFGLVAQTLTSNGFQQYEISNYARPGHYSQHNTNYWLGVNYLGLGPSAHSYNGQTRQWNVANNSKYMSGIAGGSLPTEMETLSETDRLNEYIMTSLRTMWGLDLKHLDTISPGASTQILKLAESYFAKAWLVKTGDILLLTDDGKLYADSIAADLFF